MRLVHYAAAPVVAVHSVSQERPDRDMHPKPQGLWVSVEGDDGWREWCIGEDWNLESLTHEHDVTLADDARLLWIGTVAAHDAFTCEFGKVGHGLMLIRWPDVAARWQGIVIAPYIYARRSDLGAYWYWGWDCASGCIWDARAIAAITLRAVVPVPDRVS